MDKIIEGLAQPKEDWIKVKGSKVAPIDRLAPGSDQHDYVLKYLLGRLESSEAKMSKMYGRWRLNEQKVQAYLQLSDAEEILKQINESGKAPIVTNIVVPYSFATISTIVTYLVNVFCGRKPMFPVTANDPGNLNKARAMELLLQYNAEKTRLARQFFQFFQDGEIYGVSIIRVGFKTERKLRTVWKPQESLPIVGRMFTQKMVQVREERITYQGNITHNVDPFMFFPDPRVPMNEVAKKGEFVFWRSFAGLHTLKTMQAYGEVKWIEHRGAVPTANTSESNRNLNISDNGIAGRGEGQLADFAQIDQGTVEIIPAELGLGTSELPEKWIFSIANKKQIIQAEPFAHDHDMHPVCVSEPYTMGYSFGQPGLSDYLNPLQDTVSWFVNSHVENVRTAINNMLVVDPSMVEMQDVLNPAPGKAIRLKRASYGQDTRKAITQLNVSDVTRGHVADMEQVIRMADSISAVNDNLRGLQDSGSSRKTATEVRTSGQASASRLASHAMLIGQSVCDLTEMLTLNLQQFSSQTFNSRVLGDGTDFVITPEMIVGDYYFPVSDGTLPTDKLAELDLWKEIMMGVGKDPELRSMYDIGKIFEFVATLGGAKNVNEMKKQGGQPPQMATQTQFASQEAIDKQLQAGNMIPIGGQFNGAQQGTP